MGMKAISAGASPKRAANSAERAKDTPSSVPAVLYCLNTCRGALCRGNGDVTGGTDSSAVGRRRDAGGSFTRGR